MRLKKQHAFTILYDKLLTHFRINLNEIIASELRGFWRAFHLQVKKLSYPVTGNANMMHL